MVEPKITPPNLIAPIQCPRCIEKSYIIRRWHDPFSRDRSGSLDLPVRQWPLRRKSWPPIGRLGWRPWFKLLAWLRGDKTRAFTLAIIAFEHPNGFLRYRT
jgi:hypothetical protein